MRGYDEGEEEVKGEMQVAFFFLEEGGARRFVMGPMGRIQQRQMLK